MKIFYGGIKLPFGNTATVYLYAVIMLCMLIELIHVVPAHAEDFAPQPETDAPIAEESSQKEMLWEWDPYYTDVSINIPLSSKPIPTITSDSEAVIYRDLIEGSIIPRYMLLEASVYPLPVLGTYLKRNTPKIYGQGRIDGSNINLIESVTAGFQEPWAVSAFFGNIARLDRPGETRVGSNMGYTGYLISAGSKHIKRNVLIDDIWRELEWKIKGKRDYPDEKMSWSFRIGGKFNDNPDITDVIYFGIYRTNLDHRAFALRWLKNSTIDLKVQLSQHSGKVIRQDIVIGKKFPMDKQNYTPTLDIGLVWDSPDEYSGVLRDHNNSTLTLLFRPSIEF